MSTASYPVIMVLDEAGYWCASCPALPGCFSQGRTRAEALDNIREAIELTISCASEEGWTPLAVEVESVTVAA